MSDNIATISKTISDEFLTFSMTPSVIKNLITPLPDSADTKVNKWVKNNQVFLRELVAKPSENHLAENRKLCELLKKSGIKNLSRGSFIFEIPETGYFVQIIGPTIKAWILLHGKPGFMESNRKPTSQWYKQYPDIFNNPTYQTISRFACYQHYKSLNKTNIFKNFSIPPVYLKQVPGRPDTLSDENYIAIQKGVDLNVYKEVKLKQNLEYFVGLTDERIIEFLNVLAVLGLWDIANNILINPKTGKFLYTDLEKYYMSEPTCFYRKCKSDLRWQILYGIKGIGGYNPRISNPLINKHSLVNILVENDKRHDAIRIFRLVKDFLVKNNMDNWPEYKDYSCFFPDQLFSSLSTSQSFQKGQPSKTYWSKVDNIPGGYSDNSGDIPGDIPGGYSDNYG